MNDPRPRTRRASLVLATAALVAACQATAPSGAPSGGPTASGPSGTAGASGAPVASAGSSPAAPGGSQAAIDNLVSLTLDDSGPFIRPEDGPNGANFALPAAGARTNDGGYVLFVVWFTQNDPEVWITVSTSPDGETWTVGTDRILEDLGVGDPDPGPIPSGALQLEDGSWLLYGWAADAGNPEFFHSWRASAPDLDGSVDARRAAGARARPAGRVGQPDDGVRQHRAHGRRLRHVVRGPAPG